jgi:hypothetical protein
MEGLVFEADGRHGGRQCRSAAGLKEKPARRRSKPGFSALATGRTSALTPRHLKFPTSFPTHVKAHELYSQVDPALVTQILDWFRANDRNVYRSAVATLAGNRKLRPVFVEKKSLKDQYAWILKTLKLRACDTIGEHLLQAYLMSAQQSLLGMFCDGMGIAHDGKGSVVGDLPKNMDKARLDTTIDRLADIFDHNMLAMYLHCFNMQVPNGWPVLSEKLASDQRLRLGGNEESEPEAEPAGIGAGENEARDD